MRENTFARCATCGAPEGVDCRTIQGRISTCEGREPSPSRSLEKREVTRAQNAEVVNELFPDNDDINWFRVEVIESMSEFLGLASARFGQEPSKVEPVAWRWKFEDERHWRLKKSKPDDWPDVEMQPLYLSPDLENGPATLADANTNPPLSDLSSLRKGAEDRIRELEKALETAEWQRDRLSKSRFHWVQRYLALRDRAALQESRQ